MTAHFQTLEIESSWGNIRVEFLEGKPVRCSLPFLSSQPEQPFSIASKGRDATSVFILNMLAGRAAKVPEIGPVNGTEFQKKIWRAIAGIPAGQTRTYGELAEAIGSPGAVRAVGSACGRNPLPLFIPCHRVVAANGGPGGFSAGLPWKDYLLRLERKH
jgi:O-6-methylguanine DNA methyltransferase